MSSELFEGGALNIELLTRMYQRAVNIQMGLEKFSIHPVQVGPRFGASDSTCPRLAFLKTLRKELLPAFSTETQRKFRVGDIFHEMADDGIEKVLWSLEGEVIKVAPFKLRCFPDLFEGLDPNCVSGTPDHILILPLMKALILVDQKSANDFGFAKNKKTGASMYHKVQVGTYLDGLMRSPLKGMITTSAMSICYMSKESVEVSVQPVSADSLAAARQYWGFVADAMRSEGSLPPALPREEWACGYCPFFSDNGKLKKEKALERCSCMSTLKEFDAEFSVK